MMNTDIPLGYSTYKSVDPFPDIPPALLNSADIYDYVQTAKIIQPFEPERLKSASYDIPFEGEVFVWNSPDKRSTIPVKKGGQTFTLGPNSIVYLHLNACFYLPDYIAIRFNLKITHVHRGLLLGTGPIVDPGFCGRLLIPLHNLTANPYHFFPGTELIKVEFTKLSPNKRWQNTTPIQQHGVYQPFPEGNRFLPPEKYFERSNQNNPIQSSIPTVGKSAERAAREAEISAKRSAKDVQDAKKLLYRLGLAASILGFVGIAALIYGGYQVTTGAIQTVQDSSNYVKDAKAHNAKKFEELEKEIAFIKAKLPKK